MPEASACHCQNRLLVLQLSARVDQRLLGRLSAKDQTRNRSVLRGWCKRELEHAACESRWNRP